MYLKKITLKNFRNFDHNEFYFNPFITIIIGKNAVGKTNLLEAIYFLNFSAGFREEKLEELIKNGKKTSEVLGSFKEEDEEIIFRLILENIDSKIKKHLFINKIKKSTQAYFSQTPKAVIFSPSFLFLIEADPEKRRRYFDQIISLFDYEYKKRLINYENGLRRRNKILETVDDLERLKEELVFWNDFLIEQAKYLVEKRKEIVDFYNQHPNIDHYSFFIDYQPCEISQKTLAETFNKQLYQKKTLVGPQRDTFEFYLKKKGETKNVHHFASRSEQRLTLFWLILNELKIYQEKINKRPMLLLDDIFSELDVDNQNLILKLINQYQTVITTTQPEILNLITLPHSLITLS